jgi:hypothetical protein
MVHPLYLGTAPPKTLIIEYYRISLNTLAWREDVTFA